MFLVSILATQSGPISKMADYLIGFFLLVAVATPSMALMACDCGQEDTNITTVDLENVQECPTTDSYDIDQQKKIQVIQTRLYQTVHVHTCHVEIYTEIKYCGAYSHTADVWNGKRRAVKFLKRSGCQDLHRDEQLQYITLTIANLKSNTTRTAWVPVVGHVTNDGECTVGTYSIEGTTYKNVIVISMVTITMKDFWAKVYVKNDLLHLPSGRTCNSRKSIVKIC